MYNMPRRRTRLIALTRTEQNPYNCLSGSPVTFTTSRPLDDITQEIREFEYRGYEYTETTSQFIVMQKELADDHA